jgi:AcrR family transcriptional regulator
MNTVLANLKIQVNEKIFVKNPETSSLGKKLIQESIVLIDEIGFDNFTFKKLGEKIGSNESSIYRYFENKHKLLVYLTSWYWSWIEYRLVFSTTNVENPFEKLKKAITIVTEQIEDDQSTHHIDERILNRIVIAEFTKTLHTKEVDEENKIGFFVIYQRIIGRISKMVLDVNPHYKYPNSLVSAIVEGALHQHFLKVHFQSITDCDEQFSPTHFYLNLMENALEDRK